MGTTKDQVLDTLERQRGTAVSGQHISDQLGISRAAIWRAIKELQDEGHAIEATPRVGYRMLPENSVITEAGILACLDPATAKRVQLQVFPELESTNTEAKRMAILGARHGTVVIADRQSNGRGRLGRSFFSPPGCGVYMSIIIRPEMEASKALLATIAAAVGVCNAVEELGGPVASIKWVNDIYCNGRKVCGILTEGSSGFESGKIESVIIGIGINHSTPMMAFPEELRHIAGSLFPDTVPQAASRNRLAALVVQQIMHLTDDLGEERIIDDYRRRSLVVGKRVTVLTGGLSYEAEAIGIDDCGALIVRLDDTSVRTLSSGEVSIRQPQDAPWSG